MKNSDEFSKGVADEYEEHSKTIRAFFPKADEETLRKIAAALAETHLALDPQYYSKVEHAIKKA